MSQNPQYTDQQAQAAAISASVKNWTYRDPVASADWLEAQPESPTKDAALVSFSSTLSRTNPSLALDWAGNITDENKRKETVGGIIKQWYKTNPDAASEFINKQP